MLSQIASDSFGIGDLKGRVFSFHKSDMSDQHCFHCNLPVLEEHPSTLKVFGKVQSFCCQGCKAVCHAIVSSGNEDYYHYREVTGKTATTGVASPQHLVKQLKLYDKPEIQRDFVRTCEEEGKVCKEAWLILEEIRCAACMWLNERTLRQLEGVLEVQADYTGQQLKVRWDSGKTSLSTLLEAIHHIGYRAHPFDPQYREALNREQEQRSIKRILFAIILGMMVMQTAIGSYFFGAANDVGEYPLWITLSRWSSLLATGVILAYPGQLFFRNAWRDLRNRTLGMDVPVALGLLVAWLGSLHATITGTGEVYYESIAMFVLFILVARYVELRARMSATALLDRTAKIIPATARKIIQGTQTLEEIAVIELQPGDRIQLSPGETVPVDGVLCSAQSRFDESLISGEAHPVQHVLGDNIMGGSITVEQPVEIEVQRPSRHSTLGKIQQLAQQSVNDKPYYVDIAEQVAGKFVAAILLIATLTFLYWLWVDPHYAIAHMVSVLIVTCPCALALAAPVALSLCAGGLAHFHVTALRMSAIEEISHIDTVVFDKTGTLTQGKPKLARVIVIDSTHGGRRNETEAQYLSLASSMEQHSEHPFAIAIREAASDLPETHVAQLKNHPGQGIEAVFNHHHWRLGNETFVGQSTLHEKNRIQIETLRQQGMSILYLGNETGVQAILCLTDPLREGIHPFLESIASLTSIKNSVILSGDHPQSVSAIASVLGITEAYGGLSPQQKLSWLQQYQQQGHRVLMLGDGINDAPTLAAANVSMTFSEATDLAQSHSDLMILRHDYCDLAGAIHFMRKTRRIILQNLSWAILYNVLAVPAAAMGFVTPWMAAIGMSLSSFVVILNSLRLHRVRESVQ